MRVLVVEDDDDLREVTARWLRADGHEVLVASSGRGALAAVDRHGMPQAAVLDVAMPGMDGVELLRRLRERDPGLPALFLTVLWSGPQVQRMRAAGGVYMAKPFTAGRLRTAVRGLLPGAGVPDDGGGG
ncbi:MAG TPA: response regulator [Rugosimonospora sp.]|nr:response regulator [Rugosimonospora sp.]